MSKKSQSRKGVKQLQHCRYCNHILKDPKSPCPGCKKKQIRSPEFIVLALVTLVLAVVVYVQYTEGVLSFGTVDEQAERSFEPFLNQASVDRRIEVPDAMPQPELVAKPFLPAVKKRSLPAASAKQYRGTGFEQGEAGYPEWH